VLDNREDSVRLLVVELDGGVGDVPRNAQGIALLGDPRNDVQLFMSQMHVAFLRLHNWLVGRLRQDGVAEADVFEEARRAAMWHYHWLLLKEFLPGLIGPELVAELLDEGARYFQPQGGAFIPLEFAVDADVESFRSVEPSWRPSLPSRRPGHFSLDDVLIPV
jgi:hypothetical protein